MRVEWQLALGWLAFGGTHLLGSSRLVRPRLVKRLGLRGFKAAYSLVAFPTLAWLVVTYWTHRHAGSPIMATLPGAVHVTEALLVIAFLFLGLGVAQPSATSTLAELGAPIPKTARGIQRITRHPVNFAFALFGIGHAVANTSSGDWVFWLGWPVFTALAAIHQDARARAAGDHREFLDSTSAFPFAAILAGRQRLAWRELSWIGAGVGLGLVLALRLLHGRLIGGFGG